MAPKLRHRPAARVGAVAKAKARPKAKAGAKARAAAKAKGAAAPRQRRGPRMKRPARGGDGEEKAGKRLRELSMEELGRLDKIVLKEGRYYHRAVDVCGKVRGARLEGREVFLDLEVSGTMDEDILKTMTGRPDRLMSIHVCGEHCGGELSEETLIHGGVFEEVDGAGAAWMSNLKGVVETPREDDENQRLREEAERVRKEESDRKKREKGEDDPPKKKKKKKEKEKKRKKKEKKGSDQAEEDETEEDLEVGQRPLGAVYQGTGLDPEYKRRKKMIRKARRLGQNQKKKKKKGSKSGSSQEETSGSTDSSSTTDGGGLFEDEQRLRRIWTKYPGCLSSAAVQEAKLKLVTAAGTAMGMEKRSLPPVMTQYARQVVIPTASPVMGQEVLTVAMTLDLLLAGKVAQAVDVLSQRFKALESLGRGSHWTVGRQFELVRLDQSGLADSVEARAAARQAKEEDKLRGLVTRPFGGRNYESGGDRGGKGYPKKGKDNRYKGRQDDTRGKGNDGKKDDNKGGWQKQK